MTHENVGLSDFIPMICVVVMVAFGGWMIYEEYTTTHGAEYEIGYENGYSDGMIEHLDERYVLCKGYIADTRYSDQTPRMRGYSEGYIKGYEEWISR